MTAPKPCVDCVAEGITTKRKLATDRKGNPVPGPRCATHHRARRGERRETAQEKRWLSVYNISAEEYWEIYRLQGGKCAFCRRATGARKNLSVDHDHETGEVRGLLCGHDNLKVLGHARDEIEFFERAIDYLKDPPARQALGGPRYVPAT